MKTRTSEVEEVREVEEVEEEVSEVAGKEEVKTRSWWRARRWREGTGGEGGYILTAALTSSPRLLTHARRTSWGLMGGGDEGGCEGLGGGVEGGGGEGGYLMPHRRTYLLTKLTDSPTPHLPFPPPPPPRALLPPSRLPPPPPLRAEPSSYLHRLVVDRERGLEH